MFPKLELLLVERAGHFEHHIAEHQRRVVDGYFCLGLRDEFAVEIYQAYRGCHLIILE